MKCQFGGSACATRGDGGDDGGDAGASFGASGRDCCDAGRTGRWRSVYAQVRPLAMHFLQRGCVSSHLIRRALLHTQRREASKVSQPETLQPGGGIARHLPASLASCADFGCPSLLPRGIGFLESACHDRLLMERTCV